MCRYFAGPTCIWYNNYVYLMILSYHPSFFFVGRTFRDESWANVGFVLAPVLPLASAALRNCCRRKLNYNFSCCPPWLSSKCSEKSGPMIAISSARCLLHAGQTLRVCSGVSDPWRRWRDDVVGDDKSGMIMIIGIDNFSYILVRESVMYVLIGTEDLFKLNIYLFLLSWNHQDPRWNKKSKKDTQK